MAVRYYQDLIVWKKSMDLAEMVYKAVRYLPQEEIYALSDQMRRAVVSIPSNIAEGQQRNSSKDFKHFLFIAQGSLGELETQIILCERLNYFTKETASNLLNQCKEVGKLLYGFINFLQKEIAEGR